MPIDLIYDIAVEETVSEWGKCIHAPEEIFRVVAGLLFKLSTEKPDIGQEVWLQRGLVIDYDMQAALFAFATQLLTGDLCIEGGDMLLRQKPDNVCILQQNQGGEWVDVFDYSLCMQPLKDAVQAVDDKAVAEQLLGTPQQLVDFMKDYRDRYDDTSASYDPDLTNPEQSTEAAICEAIKTIVTNAIDASKKLKENESEDLDRTAVIIGVGVAVGAVVVALASGGLLGPAAAAFASTYFAVGSAATVATPLVLGLTTAGLAAWSQAIKDTAAETFDNESAKNEVICQWYQALRFEADIPYETFSAAPDFSEASESAVNLWAAIQPVVQQEAYYVAFLRAWKRAVQLVGAGVDSDCTCNDVPDVGLVVGDGFGTVLEYKGKVADGDRYRITAGINTFGANRHSVINTTTTGFLIVDVTMIDDGDGSWFRWDGTSSNEGVFILIEGTDDFEDIVSNTRLVLSFDCQNHAFESDEPLVFEVVVKWPDP